MRTVAAEEGVLALWNGFLPYYLKCGGESESSSSLSVAPDSHRLAVGGVNQRVCLNNASARA